MGDVSSISVRLIRFPDARVRKHVSEEHTLEFVLIAKQAERWPFPPVKIRLLEKPLEGRKYEIVDGIHRFLAAAKLRMGTIPCEIVTVKDAGWAFLKQLSSNNSHGWKVDLDERDAAIFRSASQFQIPQAEIAKELGLSEASVSRIVRNIQRGAEAKAAKEKGKGKGKKGKKGTAGTKPRAFSAKGFWADTLTMVQTYNEHAASAAKYAGNYLTAESVTSVESAFKTLSEAVETIFASKE